MLNVVDVKAATHSGSPTLLVAITCKLPLTKQTNQISWQNVVKLFFKNYAFFCNAVVFGRENLHALKYPSRAKTSTLNYAQDIKPRRLTHRTSTNVPQKSSTDCTPSPSSIAAQFSLCPANKQLYKRTSSFTQLTAEKIERKFAAPANLFSSTWIFQSADYHVQFKL